MSLRIPLGTECGTVQSGRGRYVNHVVIQANPIIMQDTDKTVRVECAFTAEDQTVSFRPTAGGRENGGGISVTVPFQPTGTNIVTNTAPTPAIRMRVVRRTGSIADVVGLGEELQLRIEIDENSAFGLFARNLEARTDNGELLNLIDSTGCPINDLIFPELSLEQSSKALFANFKAFRFPSTPTVNFIATVQFCQELCEPVPCSQDVDSYGRRKKRSLGNETEGYYSMKTDDDESEYNSTRLSRSTPTTRSTTLPPNEKDLQLPGNLIPEKTVLGLRLTVGEDQVYKPRPPSKEGEGGRFPSLATTPPHPESSSSYYPAFYGYDLSDPSFVCSPQSTVISVAAVLVIINIVFVAAFVFFYRTKKKIWMKNKNVDECRPPPRPPLMPRGANTAVYSNSGQDVMFKNPYDAGARSRLPNHATSTLSNLGKPTTQL